MSKEPTQKGEGRQVRGSRLKNQALRSEAEGAEFRQSHQGADSVDRSIRHPSKNKTSSRK